MSPRHVLIATWFIVSALVALPALAAADDGFIFTRVDGTTTGKPISVRAEVYADAGTSRSCRLQLRPPAGRVINRPARVARGSKSVLRWRTQLPVTAAPGRWIIRVRCGGIDTAQDFAYIDPAITRVRAFDPQFVRLSESYSDSSYYAWYTQIENPFGYEIHNIGYRVVLRDADGRIVKTVTGSGSTALTAHEGGLIAGRTEIAGEVPASISVTATGEVSRRMMRPNRIDDLRLVIAPPYEGASPEINVRGEAVNTSNRAVSATAFFVALFDPAGVLVNAESDLYPGDIPVGQSRGLELDLSRDGASRSPRVEAFWPASPDD